MAKNQKQRAVIQQGKMRKTYLGTRLLFVVLWFVLIALLSNSDLLRSFSSSFIIAIILLAPIAVAIFPVMYQIDNIYSTNPKKSPTPKWQHTALGVVGTSVFLGILWYLFMIITFAL